MTAVVASPAPGVPSLHKAPALAPVYAVACLAAAFACVLRGARTIPQVERALLRVAEKPAELERAALAVGALLVVCAFMDHVRRLRAPVVPLYLRINRAVAYGLGATLIVQLMTIVQDEGYLRALLHEERAQLVAACITLGAALVSYAAWLHPLCDSEEAALEPYQAVVARLRDTYDFVLGVAHPSDWKRAVAGAREWFVLPEASLWTNLLVFGGIGSGKTSTLAYPIAIQAMGKFPNDAGKRPSLVVLDLKGDNAARLYDFAKMLGREHEYWCVRPGNALDDAKGKALIPRDRFLSWNAVGGKDAADVRALLLLDGLEATNKTPSHQYFYDVESEFLSATLQLLDQVKGHGVCNLFDLYLFGLDADHRRSIINSEQARGSTAQLYFQRRFEKLAPDEQSHLISGLAAKLARLSSPSLQSTFCPRPGDEARPFPGFHDLVVNQPGIVVFSVPEALYSQELARLLGVAFMRAFQTQMLRRTDSQFGALGGNTDRLVLLLVDECWAYMNPGIASFTAVSRQARTCNVFLSQSLDQIALQYRDTVVGNFRTKALLGVNDELTLKTFSNLFGETKELQASQSTSESLNDVRHGVFVQGASGKSQGLSTSTSISERTVPRFSQTEIQHLPEGRMIVHLYDGKAQREAQAAETTPYYRLPYFLFHPQFHDDVRCKARGSGRLHVLRERDGGAVRCDVCGLVLTGEKAADLAAYRAAFPDLVVQP